MVRLSLHTKFLALIIGSLIVFLAILSYVILQREARVLGDKIEEQQHLLAFTLYSELRSNMLKGTPRSTIELLYNLQGRHGLVKLSILRRNGNPAFGMIGGPETVPQLEETFTSGEDHSFVEDGPPPLHTILFPLKNDLECRTCHREDRAVLGVLRIALSRQDALEEIRRSSQQLALILALLVAFVALVLYLAVRNVILKPLDVLRNGAKRIGGGDLGHRISMSAQDELQGLAHAFNSMTEQLESSHGVLEDRIRERTAQLQVAMEDIQNKADRLYSYGRDMATVSRISTKVFNAEMTLEELLDNVMWGLTKGLQYPRSLICLVDRKRVWLEVKRNNGLDGILPPEGLSLLDSDPLVEVVRKGVITVLDPGTGTVVNMDGSDQGANRLQVIPLLSRTHDRACWKIMSCIKTDCPAHTTTGSPCWLMTGTHCSTPLRESYADQFAFCMTCRVFPVIGVLIVESQTEKHAPRGRNMSVLRILAAETAAALENHRLHEANQRMVGELLELNRVTAIALSELSLTKALESFSESALKFSGLDACSFWLLSPDGRELHRKGGGCVDARDSMEAYPDTLPAAEGLLGRAMQQGSSFIVNNTVSVSDTTALARAAAAHGLLSLLAIPIRGDDGPRGVFAVHKKGTMPFLETEITAFMLLANQAALAINVCVLNEELTLQNRELARQSSLLGGILSSMSSGIMLLDKNGSVSLVNQLGAGILRTRKEALMNQDLMKLYPETASFLDSDAGMYREIDILSRDGHRIPVGFSSTYYHGASGEQEGTIVVYRDLSEIRALQKELLGKERFAAMGRVVAGVAHEIRNPLFGISSVGQILAKETLHPAHQELIQALLAETKRMNQLVEELLMYGRPMQLQREECDLAGIWEEVTAMHREELEQRRIRITGDLHMRRITAYVDAHQIRQVFLNLLRNAVDASPEGGEISIRLLLGQRFIIMQITDTGVGIPLALQDKIFDLFFTTKPKGTGLGLAICRKIIQDHGGDIGVDSVEGRGTAVTIKLPYHGLSPLQ